MRLTKTGIEIDRSLCSTCGLCEAACPTGALHLPLSDLAPLLHKALAGHQKAVGCAPTVVMCEDTGEAEPGQSGESSLFIQTASIGRIGVEILIAAVAWGAARVFVRLPRGAPSAITAALCGQMETASAILEGLGQSPERLAIIEEGADLPATMTIQGVVPARFEPPENKRDLLRAAVDHLCVQGRPEDGSAGLEPGAHYGEITVAARSCSLCLACAGACPTGAISGTDDHPGIRFVEALCLQCGRCAAVCPEHALSLNPRLAFDRSTAESPRVLAEENPACCIVCGVPFASPGMIARVSTRLEHHWMYRRAESVRRLQMCAACRVRDLLTSPGAMHECDSR